MDGELKDMSADLDAATRAGAVELPEWFNRFASVEATALDDRVVSQ